MNHSYIYVFFLTLLLGTFADADAAELYRWQSEDGVWHFSEVPPTNRPSETISIKTKKQSPSAHQPEDSQKDTSEKPPTKTSSPSESLEVAAEDRALRAKNCKIGRENLESLSNKGRIRYQLEGGEVTYLTLDEKESRIKYAKTLIKENCK